MLVRLAHAGIDVAVAGSPKQVWAEELARAGIPITRIEIRGRLDLSAIGALRRIIGRGEYDLLHAFNNHTVGCAVNAAIGQRARVVCFRGYMGHAGRFNPSAWVTYFHPRLSRIICASKAVERYFLGVGMEPEKLITIYKGHDVHWYEFAPADLSEFGIPRGAFVVGFCGRARPRKGVNVLIEAASLIPPERQVHFLIVGPLERDSKLAEDIRRLSLEDRVHLAGFRADAPRLTGTCDLFALPSLDREGFPRAVVEAMAQGVAPIVSDVGGMPELVEHGVSGLVVPQADARALADAILELHASAERRIEIGRAARQRILSVFPIERTVRETVALYEALVAAP
jgi:glycosyltransferase involved in cell wall biosynthesis